MITGKQLVSYCNEERLFSTGNSELDSLLEEVYYSGIEDGYTYAQKEFDIASNIGTNLAQNAGNIGKNLGTAAGDKLGMSKSGQRAMTTLGKTVGNAIKAAF